MNSESEMGLIRDFITQHRARLGVDSLGTARRFECSGFASGENGDIRVLLYDQLMFTREGFGAWAELEHEDIRQAAVSLIQAEQNEQVTEARL